MQTGVGRILHTLEFRVLDGGRYCRSKMFIVIPVKQVQMCEKLMLRGSIKGNNGSARVSHFISYFMYLHPCYPPMPVFAWLCSLSDTQPVK